MTLEFRACALDEEPAASLAQGMRDEISALYDGLALDGPDMPKGGPAELGPPHGTFVVGVEDGVPVCCGGLKRLPDGIFGPETLQAVKDFQKASGLVVDGIVGRATLAELERQIVDLINRKALAASVEPRRIKALS